MTYGLGILSAWAWRVKDFQVFFSAGCSQKRKDLEGTRAVLVSKVTLAILGSSGPKVKGRHWAHVPVCLPSQKPSLAGT